MSHPFLSVGSSPVYWWEGRAHTWAESCSRVAPPQRRWSRSLTDAGKDLSNNLLPLPIYLIHPPIPPPTTHLPFSSPNTLPCYPEIAARVIARTNGAHVTNYYSEQS